MQIGCDPKHDSTFTLTGRLVPTVIDILKEEMPKIEKNVKWDGMYNTIATKVVKSIKEEIVKY